MSRVPLTRFVLFALIAATSMMPASADITIDNDYPPTREDPDVSIPSSWAYRSGKTDEYLTDMWFSAGSTDIATYQATLPTAGYWGVEMWWTTETNYLSADYSVGITHASGTTEYNQDMTAPHAGEWVGVGLFEFNAGVTTLSIDPSKGSGQHVADGVRFREDPIGMVFRQTSDSVDGSRTGSWSSSSSGGYISADTSATAEITATQMPLANITYEVEFFYSGHSSRTQEAVLQLFDGTDLLVDMTIDQTTPGTQSVNLGQYTFSDAPEVRIEATDTDTGYTSFWYTQYTVVDIVPEPASLTLLGLGGLLAAIRGRRRP